MVVDKSKALEKSKGFANEFREFIMRGNVMDLAVGVIIGGAFQSIINSLVNDIIMPVISVLTGGIDFSNWFVSLDGSHYSTLAAAQDAGTLLDSLDQYKAESGKYTKDSYDKLVEAEELLRLVMSDNSADAAKIAAAKTALEEAVSSLQAKKKQPMKVGYKKQKTFRAAG